MPSLPSCPRGEIAALTSLRGIAALLVFLFHFATDAPGLLGVLAHEGHVGVTVFFVLSGFLITGRYFGEFASGRARWREYALRRVARILPLYFTVFLLSAWASGADVLAWWRLPEWTLTQAFFSPSLHELVIPTSWSLTLEECFYATAPLLFLAIAAGSRRIGVPWAALVVLATTTVALWALGGAVVEAMPDASRETFGFLGSRREMATHTFFGRFVEFAIGSAAGLAWVYGLFAPAWARTRGLLSATIALLAMAAIAGSEWAMARAGDVAGRGWEAAWAWNLPVALASGVLIVALTDTESPVARLLSVPPLPYLGRVSYALYLIQITPLGKDLMYAALPARMPLYVVALYAGMTLVSALLYEVVEEPARRGLLRLTLGRPEPSELPRVAWPRRAVAVVVLAAALALGVGTATVSALRDRQGLPSLGEVEAVMGPASDRILRVPADAARDGDGSGYRVVLPRRWMEGPAVERRSPTWLWVWADGRAVPFTAIEEARERAARGEPAASYKRPRVHVAALHGVTLREEMAVGHRDSAAWLAVQADRLRRAPSWALAALLAWGAGLAIGGWALVRCPPSRLAPALRLLAAATTVYLVLGVHETPLAIPSICAIVAALVASSGAVGPALGRLSLRNAGAASSRL